MKIVKKFFDVTPDMRDGFGRRREFDRQEEYSLDEYVARRLRCDAHATPGEFECMKDEIDRLRLSFARLVETLAEKIKLTGEEIAQIVGDYIDGEEEEITLEEGDA